MAKPTVIKPDRRLAEEAHEIKKAAEAAKEEVKVPVRGPLFVEKLTDKECLSSQIWHCPDCNGELLGEPFVDGLRCDNCSISWAAGFMTDVLLSEKRPDAETMKAMGARIVRMPDRQSVVITDGTKVIVLKTAEALLLACVIQNMASAGDVLLEG